jgi:hypothetical protein
MPPGIEIVPRQIRQPLFAGTDEILHRLFGFDSIRHRSSVTKLGKAWPSPDQMTSLIDAMFAQVSQNWDAARTAATKPPSSKNWRWCEPVLGIAAHNKSPEVVLERAIVKACLSTGRSDWTNQVPIASGVVGSDSHKRSAIDLIHQTRTGAFDFIELKINSDTPLFAAIEVIQYGLIWLLSRRDRVSLGYREKQLLDASEIRLCVLAPSNYYRGYDFSMLADGLNAGLSSIVAGQERCHLLFEFQKFPDALLRAPRYSDEEALAVINTRQALVP